MDLKIDLKIESTVRKLIALSERGCGGEKENAERFLFKFLKKHGLSIDQFSSDQVSEHSISFNSKRIQKMLIAQIINSVIGSVSLYFVKGKRTVFYFDCTESQYAEIKIKHEVYSVDLEAGLSGLIDDYYAAFLSRNDIFFHDQECSDDEDIDPDRIQRIMALMSAINPSQVLKRITK